MDLSEIREFTRIALWEQLRHQKGKWFRVLLIIVLEAFFIPEAAVIIAFLMIASLIAVGIYNYRTTVKLLEGQMWTVFRIGDGRLRVARNDCSEIPCREIQFIRRTKRLLMLGYMQSPKRPAWFVMPLRVFGDGQELEAFLDLIRNPKEGGGDGFEEAAEYAGTAVREPGYTAPQEYMRFSYLLDKERWVRFQKGAADLLNGGSLGSAARRYVMMIWGCVMTAVLISCTYIVVGTFYWTLVCYSMALAVWLILRLYCRDPEKGIRKQLRTPEIAARACGSWQVVLAEKGITVNMPMEMKNFYPWESLEWLLETEEVFYVFHKDKKHFIMIAKEWFVRWEQVDVFHRICAEQGIKK
ncbi:MAG: hypothetical protein K2O15_04205, partial [Lachnospiraceae bacterium]|nr:hypothetical protein [Lachnospiraceae bacterium]